MTDKTDEESLKEYERCYKVIFRLFDYGSISEGEKYFKRNRRVILELGMRGILARDTSRDGKPALWRLARTVGEVIEEKRIELLKKGTLQ